MAELPGLSVGAMTSLTATSYPRLKTTSPETIRSASPLLRTRLVKAQESLNTSPRQRPLYIDLPHSSLKKNERDKHRTVKQLQKESKSVRLEAEDQTRSAQADDVSLQFAAKETRMSRSSELIVQNPTCEYRPIAHIAKSTNTDSERKTGSPHPLSGAHAFAYFIHNGVMAVDQTQSESGQQRKYGSGRTERSRLPARNRAETSAERQIMFLEQKSRQKLPFCTQQVSSRENVAKDIWNAETRPAAQREGNNCNHPSSLFST